MIEWTKISFSSKYLISEKLKRNDALKLESTVDFIGIWLSLQLSDVYGVDHVRPVIRISSDLFGLLHMSKCSTNVLTAPSYSRELSTKQLRVLNLSWKVLFREHRVSR